MKKIDIIKNLYKRYLKETNSYNKHKSIIDDDLYKMLYGNTLQMRCFLPFLLKIQPLMYEWCHEVFEKFLKENNVQEKFYNNLYAENNIYYQRGGVLIQINNPKDFMSTTLPTRYLIDGFGWPLQDIDSWHQLHFYWGERIYGILNEDVE